jgi:copper resistance protein D
VTEAGLRFLHYAVLLGLFGWTAYRAIGLRAPVWAGLAFHRAALIVLTLVAVLLSSVLQLTSIAAMMGMPVGDLNTEVVRAMLLGTGMGWAFLIRFACLLAALAALGTSRQGIASLCFAVALMTLGWSGHAAASEGMFGLVHRLNNGVHLIAAGLWLGAIGWFLYLVRAAHRRDDVPPQALLAVMHGFAPLGVALVGIVALTGIINAQLIFGLQNGSSVLSTHYGLLLAAKVALVLVMMGFGAHNAHIGRGYARGRAEVARESATLNSLRASLAGELAFGVAVVALVAVFGMMSPMPMG